MTTAAGAPAASPKPLDSTIVGAWAGVVHAVGVDVHVQFTVAPTGVVQARIGERSDTGVARQSAQNASRLFLRFPGDLEAPNPSGMNRQTSAYLQRRGAGFGGVITTRPPIATGLDGLVSYWLEITRQNP